MLTREERMDKRIDKKVTKVMTAIDEYIANKGITEEREKLPYYERFLSFMDNSNPELVVRESEEYKFLTLQINNCFSVFSNGLTYEDILFYNEVANQLSNKVYDFDTETGRIKKRSLII